MAVSQKTFVLVAGGTGGHLFPALSLAKELKRVGSAVVLFTDERAASWVDRQFFDRVVFSRFKTSGGALKKVSFFFNLFLCGLKSLWFLICKRPTAVIGFGGYPSAPTVLAAQLLFIPTVLHESNAILGRANRVLSKMARFVATGFQEVQKLSRDKQIFVGTPIREQILALAKKEYLLPREEELFHLLILGGSQGSRIFSDVLPEVFKNMKPEQRKKLLIHQQVRPEFLDKVTTIYQRLFLQFDVRPFFSDVEDVLQKAHFIISRGGAITLNEIMVAGKPSLIVPLARTLDGDQMANARFYEKHQAVCVMTEEAFSAKNVQSFLGRILQDPKFLTQLSQSARKMASFDACQKLQGLIDQI